VTELLLTGGLVVDGTGSQPFRADVRIADGVITELGPKLQIDGEQLDVTGAVVAPGFVDIHTHSDLTVLASPSAASKVAQGVTTEVVGNCGLGVAPLPPGADIAAIRAGVSYLDLDPDVEWTWRDVGGYLDTVAATGPALNVATLVGHLPLHAGVVGFADRPATAAERDLLTGLLGDALDAGALGLSTGLVYAPLTFADNDELTALAAIAAGRGKVFTWHVRSYDDDLLCSVQQAAQIAIRTGCRTQISHLAAVGRRNWGSVKRALDVVDAANAAGATVNVDIYPYLHGSAPLVQLLPAAVQEGGVEAIRARLTSAAVRAEVRAAWSDRPTTWEEITLSWLPSDPPGELLGRTIADIAVELGHEPDDVAMDLLVEFGSSALMVAGGRSEDDLLAVLDHPAAVVASDGLALDPSAVTGRGQPHPRSFGCFPRYLSRYGGGLDGLAAAVRRCTSAPAAIAGLTDRGVLRPGAPADVVVFDPARMADRATFDQPQQFPDGIDLVIVNGEVVVDHNGITGVRPGRVLRA
jgi:N-acyl-D-aspartate/D-glutamate deacylase